MSLLNHPKEFGIPDDSGQLSANHIPQSKNASQAHQTLLLYGPYEKSWDEYWKEHDRLEERWARENVQVPLSADLNSK